MQRFIALVLALAMLCAAPTAAFAEGAEQPFETAVQTMQPEEEDLTENGSAEPLAGEETGGGLPGAEPAPETEALPENDPADPPAAEETGEAPENTEPAPPAGEEAPLEGDPADPPAAEENGEPPVATQPEPEQTPEEETDQDGLTEIGIDPAGTKPIALTGEDTPEADNGIMTVANEPVGLGVAYRTMAQIVAFAKDHPAPFTTPAYDTAPSITAPFRAGVLNSATLNSALNMLNQVRYIAGLNADVQLDSEMSRKVSAATLLNALNDDLSHEPILPAGMDKADPLYALGCEGASQANIAWGYRTNDKLEQVIIDGWMADDDAGNIALVGHRRWVLNPSMGKTGFGATTAADGIGVYSAMYAFDRSGNGTESRVAWPAQETPATYFNAGYPWSLSMGYEVDQSTVGVTLVRQSDSMTWTFGTLDNSEAHGDKYFFGVNNGGYGQKGCIIFRPDGLESIAAGETFDVTVAAGDTTVHYTVHFFDMDAQEPSDPCAGGHAYGEPKIEWNADHTGATASRQCDRCGALQTVKAAVTRSVKVPAACTVRGTTTYTATATFEDGTTVKGTVEAQDIPAKGHSYTAAFTWTDDNVKQTATASATLTCSACNDTQKLGATVTRTGGTDPTCETDGSATFTARAAFGGKTYTDEKTGTHTLTLPATGHEYGEPAFEWAADCKTAVVTAKCIHCDAELTETLTATAKPTTATCTEPGEVEYTVTIEIGGVPYSESKKVERPALGHDLKTKFTWAADHTATLEVTCSRCDLKESVAASVTKTGEKPATCAEPGTATYTATAVYMEKTYTDTQTVETQQALGHTYGKAKFTWNDDHTATASRKCDRCGDTQTVEATVTSSVKEQPTCTEMGTTTYTATAKFADGTETSDTRDVKDISATGHKWADQADFQWNKDNTDVTSVTLSCENENCPLPDSKQELTGVTVTPATTEATCTAAGKTVYTAEVTFDGKTYTDESTVEIPATGHSWAADADFQWNAAGTDVTSVMLSCKNENCPLPDSKQELTGVTVTPVTTDATCTEAGKTVYTAEVTFDGKTYTDESTVEIPATGHSYTAAFTWTVDNDKHTAAASATLTCGVCGDKQTVEATVTETRTEPTCETDGSVTFTAKAEFGGKTYTDAETGTRTLTLPAAGHDYDAPVFTWTEGETAPTAVAQRTCKNDPKHVQKTDAKVSVKEELKAPDCVNSGTTVYTAEVVFDGETFNEDHEVIVPATGHKWSDTWSHDDNYHWHDCENANCPLADDNAQKDGYGAHNNYNAEVSGGNVVYKCSECGTVVRTEPVQNDSDTGAMNAEVSQPQNTPAIAIKEGEFTGLLNKQDKDLLAGGVDIDFLLDVSAADTVPAADKQLVEEALPDAGGIQYFDISLTKIVNDSLKYPINDTGSTMLTLTLTIPAELQGVAGREFAVVRVHDGGTAVLSDWTSASGQTVTIQSNLFSTYALAWRDQKRPEPSGGDPQQGSSGGNTSGSGNAPAAPAVNNLRIPQTADDAPLGAAALVLLLSLAGLGVTLVLRKRSR